MAMLLHLLVLLMSAHTNLTELISTPIQALEYLQQFGYLEESWAISISLLKEKLGISAIQDFQKFAGLTKTGILDNPTLRMMNTPRCGIKDRPGHKQLARKKRYALQGSIWEVPELTYRINRYPKGLEEGLVKNEIERASKIWSEVIPLNITAREDGPVHIKIEFYEKEHGDRQPFDGPNGLLAHAFFPEFGGDVHFDDIETWTVNTSDGKDLFQVAVHEFGHSLGLSHSSVNTSIMYPFYKGYKSDIHLDLDDVSAIQKLYGDVKDISDGADPPDLCEDPVIDAITTTQDGNTYVFKGDFYWQLKDSGIVYGYPCRICNGWSGLPGNLDAALTSEAGYSFFFKDNQYWKYWNRKLCKGYPRTLRTGRSRIRKIYAAFVSGGDGLHYFLSGYVYWKFDSSADPPVDHSRTNYIYDKWRNLPNFIDAAFQWKDGNTYFFKGKLYYKYDDERNKVMDGYPRLTATDWFGCPPVTKTTTKSTPFQKEEKWNTNIYVQDDGWNGISEGVCPKTTPPAKIESTIIPQNSDRVEEPHPKFNSSCHRAVSSFISIILQFCAFHLLLSLQ